MSEDLKKLKFNFNIKEYLDTRDIIFLEEGDNINKGWIGISCLFCADDLNHLGINLKSNTFSCWKCHESGNILTLIKEIEGTTFDDAKQILKQYQKNDFYFNEDEEEKQNIKKSNLPILPKEFKYIKKGKEPNSIKKYFKKRNFPLKYIQQYKAGYCRSGKYAFHMILPIFINKKIVSFIAVDLIGNAKEKYQICPNYRALVDKSLLAYGLDDIINSEKIYIVEGYTDRWRMGKNAIALLTNAWKTSLLLKIKKRVYKTCKIIVILDMDAKRNAEQLSIDMKSIFFNNEIIFIELEKKDQAKDPDQLNKQQIKYIKNL